MPTAEYVLASVGLREPSRPPWDDELGCTCGAGMPCRCIAVGEPGVDEPDYQSDGSIMPVPSNELLRSQHGRPTGVALLGPGTHMNHFYSGVPAGAVLRAVTPMMHPVVTMSRAHSRAGATAFGRIRQRCRRPAGLRVSAGGTAGVLRNGERRGQGKGRG